MAIKDGLIKPQDVMVLRYEGPKGGPGMREMQLVTGALQGAALGETVGLITNGRFSGATRGFFIDIWCRKRLSAVRSPRWQKVT